MRKLALVCLSLFLLPSIGWAQTQRMVMLEAFSNASCPPCAAQNPAYNALTSQPGNATKVVKIKYQTNWPGTDPMNAQTQTDVAPRVTYYNITGVPSGRMDGTAFTVGSLTQAQIDNRYAVPSPFALNVSHQFSTDGDSVYITITAAAAQNINTTDLRLHVALTERHIHFNTAPGSNGETDFYWVMRKTYPNSNGTPLANVWVDGQDTSLVFGGPIPSYIYNMQELAVVAFLQENSTKEVHQAGVSHPVPLTTDGRANAILGVLELACGAAFDATVEIRNDGIDEITEANIVIKIDGAVVDTFPWSGSLISGGLTSVLITNLQAGSVGSHTLTAQVLVPGDVNTFNNSYSMGYVVASAPYTTPFEEGFPTLPFPPADWAIVNPDGGHTWNRVGVGGFMEGMGSTRMPFYLSPDGQVDYLYFPTIDLSQPGTHTSAQLKFSRAAARYLSNGQATGNDEVRIEASSDCGNTWTTIWTRAGALLATVGGREDTYVPGSPNDWRRDSASLAAFVGQDEVQLRFVGISNSGNNAYFDDLNIVYYTPSGVGSREFANTFDLQLAPNPAAVTTTLSFSTPHTGVAHITIYNALGQIVDLQIVESNGAGINRVPISLNHLSSGVYTVKVQVGNQQSCKSLVVKP